jgi:hypothetical protein
MAALAARKSLTAADATAPYPQASPKPTEAEIAARQNLNSKVFNIADLDSKDVIEVDGF